MLGRIRARHAWALCVLALTATGALGVIFGSAGGAAGAQNQQLVAASAKLAPTSPTIPAKETCASIATLASLAGLPHYPTAIASATVVTSAENAPGNPDYCNVQGMIAPQTHFELQLPLSTWQGRYLQNGCGGYAGRSRGRRSQLRRHIAGRLRDGHRRRGPRDRGRPGRRGVIRLQRSAATRRVRLRVRAGAVRGGEVHHQLLLRQQPNYSYFNGCSDGGREAMEMAERYPDDFNGIIAGAPEIYAGPLNAEAQTLLLQGQHRCERQRDPDRQQARRAANGGHQRLRRRRRRGRGRDHHRPAGLPLRSGQHRVPGRDRQQLVPHAGAGAGRARVYEGPTDPQGQRLYPGSVQYGSEGGWSVFELPPSANGGKRADHRVA